MLKDYGWMSLFHSGPPLAQKTSGNRYIIVKVADQINSKYNGLK